MQTLTRQQAHDITNTIAGLISLDSLCMICFDEAHCVSDWGESFRPEYRKVAKIRSIADVPVLALTATVTPKVKSDIEKYLYIKKDCNVIAAIPDRYIRSIYTKKLPNIHLQVQKSSSDFESELKWLLSSLERDISDSPKTLIFCRSIPTVAEIFLLFNDELGEKRFCGDFRLVEMFHSAISEDRKKLILDEFKKIDSKIRCVVATVAFGMGIYIPDIRNVVHWGAPKSILSYWQEVGRCARDGKDGVAVCYAYARSLHTNTTSADVVDMVKSTSCIRRVTLANFAIPGVTSVNHIVNPRCCCICDMDIWKH
ncbi:ATP-dependent helicase wrn-1-like [Mytilus edulis]|uniref:ATP-dependent helicase wrn-1-like n=1 Tax=Mytilus edulis TaxID=6550 RepID=UPI0039EFF933